MFNGTFPRLSWCPNADSILILGGVWCVHTGKENYLIWKYANTLGGEVLETPLSPINLCGHYLILYLFQTYKCECLCIQVMQEEFSHTVLHHNRAAASQAAKTRAGANTSGNGGEQFCVHVLVVDRTSSRMKKKNYIKWVYAVIVLSF